ncbi:MAG: Oxygen regulatory protein NreC [Verrucomicrobia subdivision 3 bacterium]|nr:Oxygen regulatory protein NreC [Limisphaerales bacterium]MCS1412468.1 Oxygen regulatory protein NreC [Limisphaerales bacterium]
MKSEPKKSSNDREYRILIVDDHPITRQGLAQLINFESDLNVCGEADGARQAFNLIDELKPDLVLLDITLPDGSGLEVIKDALALHPRCQILVLSMHEESPYAERVLRAGGRGYIMKQAGGKKIMEAIRKVLSGKVYLSDAMSAQVLESLTGGRSQDRTLLQSLTDREFEVFELIGQGKTTRAMAEYLHLSVKTVGVHRLNIKRKLGLDSASDLVSFAIRWTESGW